MLAMVALKIAPTWNWVNNMSSLQDRMMDLVLTVRSSVSLQQHIVIKQHIDGKSAIIL